MAEKKPPTTLLNRIKKMMQQDDDVGKVAKGAPVLIGGCREASTGCLEAQSTTGCLEQVVRIMPWWHHSVLPAPTTAKAMDVFMEGLVAGAVGVAEGRGAKMLTASHL